MNSETKRHIDAARQVLVGVVPNPASQIDQITYALIYKFMDDMDQSAIKNGDEPNFFIDDLEDYSWSRLMDTKIGNQERMNLYVVAFQKFAEAKQLPELFRNILKSAFLPYRSPETLGLFLKEIDYFDYSHPEELGNAYEYLLSIMSSQGDAGQFRTPRHIIDFIVDVVNPKKEDKVLDPACGTGGFLVSSYKHILEQHDGKNDPNKKEKSLTPDQRRNLMNNFEGYDIDPTMVRIAQVNMYLHQFKNPKIFQYDSLSSDERWNDKFDVVLANPPFMSPKGGIKPHNKFSIQSSRSEVLFVDYIMNHLRPNGRAGIIVPEGIIFQSGGAHKQLRKNMIEDGLYAVVSLPSGVFNPYSGVKTSILFFDNEISKKVNHVLFVKISSDGFDLGAQRRISISNDIPLAVEAINKYQKHVKDNGKLSIGGWPEDGENIDTYPNLQFVSKKEIYEIGDYNLSCDSYRLSADYVETKWQMVSIEELCDLGRGRVINKNDIQNNPGPFPVFSSQTTDNGTFGYLDTYDFDGEYVTWTTDGANAGTVFYRSGKFNCTNVCGTLKAKLNNVNMRYVAKALNSVAYKYVVHVGNPKLMNNVVAKIKIPVPPLEIQEQIVNELDGYKNIISGAKQIVKNWKPRIDIAHDWKKVKIDELVKNKIIEKPLDGNHGELHPKSSDYVEDGVPFIMANDLLDGVVNIKKSKKITEAQATGLRKGFAKNGDVLLTHKGTIGRTAILDSKCDYVILTPQVTYYRIIDKSKLQNRFLKVYFDSDTFQDRLQQLASIGATRAYIGITDQLNLEVVLPPMEIQEQIVEKVESERLLIESAKKLIDIYEQKTKDAIDKLWEQQ